ncbi:MAG: DUF302 domain-containing protein [Chitinophagales bacterium]
MEYHFSKKVSIPFDQAVHKIISELKKQGFGIITRIDLKETFKHKLNVDFRNYLILGACNPRYAYESLLEEDKLGVFLPCNVIVQEHDDGEVEVSAINPEEIMHSVDSLNLRTFATEVREQLQEVLRNL